MSPSAVALIGTLPNPTWPVVKGLPAGAHAVESSKRIIGAALEERVEGIDHNICEPGEESTFFVADLGEVYRQHKRWKLHLPRVTPFYAVKCNPDVEIIRLLAKLGTGFDCASKTEIETVLKANVDPSRIIYAQPCKTNSYVRFAASQDIKKMTFDNADELHKVQKIYPSAELFLRISTDDSSSLCRLSLKFGATMDSTRDLLSLAQKLGLNIVGVSFHVGSGASDPLAFMKAVQDARIVINQGLEYGFSMHTLDVGGGFCTETFEEMAAALTEALDQYIPPHFNIIGEPGRYYVSSAFTLACHIIARRTIEDPVTAEQSYMLYLNDGLYGNFSSIIFDHQHPVPRVLRAGQVSYFGKSNKEGSGDTVQYSIWGPTCDGIDRIAEHVRLGHTLNVGDWLYFDNMGAYTKCSATRFNGFSDCHDVIYVSSEHGATALLEIPQ